MEQHLEGAGAAREDCRISAHAPLGIRAVSPHPSFPFSAGSPTLRGLRPSRVDAPGTPRHPPPLTPMPNENEKEVLHITNDSISMKHSHVIMFRARNTMFLLRGAQELMLLVNLSNQRLKQLTEPSLQTQSPTAAPRHTPRPDKALPTAAVPRWTFTLKRNTAENKALSGLQPVSSRNTNMYNFPQYMYPDTTC